MGIRLMILNSLFCLWLSPVNAFEMTPQEKTHASYLRAVSQVCGMPYKDEGNRFWAKIRKRAGVITKKVGVRKKVLPSGNIDHVTVRKTIGFNKIFQQINPTLKPLMKKKCKTLYQEATQLGLWAIYFEPVTFKGNKIQKPKKPPRTMVRVDGKVYAVINSDGVVTFAKGRDTLWHKAIVYYRIAIGDVEEW